MILSQGLQQLHFCPKILHLDTGYDEQAAYNYLRLLKQGCDTQEARKYARRKRCQLDSTKKEIGPQNFQCLKPIFDGSRSRMGWQAAQSVKYDNDGGFKPSFTMEQLTDQNELKILKMYDDYSNKFEKALRDRMNILNKFINQTDYKLNLDESLDRSEFIDVLKNNTKQLNNIASSSFKYAKYKGIKLFEIVHMLESDLQRKQLLIEQNDSVIEQLPDKKSQDNKFLWDLAEKQSSKRSNNSAANYFFPKHRSHQSLQNSMEKLDLSKVPLTKQFGCFDPWFQNVKHKEVKIKLSEDQNKKIIGMRSDVKRHSSVMLHNELKDQSELCLCLLDEGGLGDSIDIKKIKKVKPPGGLVLQLLKGSKSKQSLANEFNQSQYLFKVSTQSAKEKKPSKKCKKDKIMDFCISTSLRGQHVVPKKKVVRKTVMIDPAKFMKNQLKDSSSPSPVKFPNDIKSYNSMEETKSAQKNSNFDTISEQSEEEPSYDFDYKLKTFMKGMISKINQKPEFSSFVDDSNVNTMKLQQQSLVPPYKLVKALSCYKYQQK